MKRKYLQVLTFRRGDGEVRTANYSFGKLENAIKDSERMLVCRPYMISVTLVDKDTDKTVWHKLAEICKED